MTGYVHSIQSLGTLDGPGVRAVIFTTGCPLRCIYCHNPDTWHLKDGKETDSGEVYEKVMRLYPYIKNGGVTFSGGEPCVQAKFITSLARRFKESGLHIALDTSGAILDEDVMELLDFVDLVLLDVKFTSEEAYKLNTGATLSQNLMFLSECQRRGLDVWIRHVVVPTVNDREDDILALCELLRPFSCVKKVELLPFKKLCLEKYEKLGIDFSLKDTPEMSEKELSALMEISKRKLP